MIEMPSGNPLDLICLSPGAQRPGYITVSTGGGGPGQAKRPGSPFHQKSTESLGTNRSLQTRIEWMGPRGDPHIRSINSDWQYRAAVLAPTEHYTD